MMLDALFAQLDGVRQRGSRWSARCPAHEDRSPSLSIAEGDRGILIRCFAGCTVRKICESLGLQQKDLFFGELDTDPRRRRAAAQRRDRQRLQREQQSHQQGTLIDALREADSFVRSRRGLDISQWSAQRLDDELDAVAAGHHLLEGEDLHG